MWRALVRYGEMKYIDDFPSQTEIKMFEKCIVCTHRGTEIGTILSVKDLLEMEEENSLEKRIIRKVTPEDIKNINYIETVIQKEEFSYCKKIINKLGISMKLITVDHLFGGEKIIFYFLADGRIDFRDLVREMARVYQTRIVMKQIGVRDETKIMGGIERCGQPLCCHTYLKSFYPITMKMAKNQLSTLDPGKISGRCGRLKCCLRYEDETYTEIREGLPKKGEKVRTSDGIGKVAGVNIIEQKVYVDLGSGERILYPAVMILRLEEEKKEIKGRSFYVTVSPLSLSGNFEINEAYVTVAADVVARFHRLSKPQVLFSLFSTKKSMFEEGGDFAQKLSGLSISQDINFTTENPNHQHMVKEFFTKMEREEDVFFGHYRGYFCPRCYSFLSHPRNVGEFCPYCGERLKEIDEDGYFFRLSKYQKILLKQVETYDFIKPALWRMELVRRIRQGLSDILVTRKAPSYGIPYPNNPNFIVQDWFESLICYLSVLVDEQRNQRFRIFWPADLHLASRDQLWIHGVIWPAILYGGGISFPNQIFFHGDWSIANGEEVPDLNKLLSLYGCDSIRYYLLRDPPFGISGKFSLRTLSEIIHTEIEGNLYRLVEKVVNLINRFHNGVIPNPNWDSTPAREIEAIITELDPHVSSNIETLQFSIALEKIWETIDRLNTYLDTSYTWNELKPEESGRQATILYGIAEALRLLAFYIWPFLPNKGEEILRYLGYPLKKGEFPIKSQGERLHPGRKINI